MKSAVIYARYSSERQNDQSIEGQLRICNQYAKDNEINIVDTYIDKAMTGTNDQRAAFQQMLADSSKPVPWDIVLVYAIDRFGRNSIEIAVNKQKLKKNGKTLISATQRTSENIDGSKNLDGILLENMYIGLAEYYSAELSQKVLRGLHENRLKGLYSGGRVCFGYRVENKKVLIHEDEAEVVRWIFQQYAEGKLAKDIIAELAAKGIRHRGKVFPMNTLYGMLRLEKYIGITRHKDGVYDNIYPAIVPKPLFDEVQRILERNKIGSRSNETEYYLRNKLFCGHCGKSMQGESGTSHMGDVKHYYKCMGRKKYKICEKKTLPKEKLENTVIAITDLIFGKTETVEWLSDRIMEVHAKRMHDKSLLNILHADRDRIKRSLDNVMKAIEEGIFTATTKQRMQDLENELALLDEKIVIEEYKAQNQLTREEVFQFLLHTARKEPNLMVHSFVQRVILFDDKIEIYYNFTNKQLPDGAPDECCRVSSNELKAFIYKDCKEKNGNSPKGSDSYRLVRSTGIEPRSKILNPFIFKAFRLSVPEKSPK